MIAQLRRVSLLALVPLAGCAAITEPFGVEDPFAIPRAFEGVARNDAMLAPTLSTDSVVVEVAQGLESSFGGDLQSKVIRALETRDIAAQPRSSEPSWTLRARYAGTFRPDKKGPAIGVIVWRLFDRDTVRREQFTTTYTGDTADTLHPTLGDQASYVTEKVVAALSLGGGKAGAAEGSGDVPVVRVGRIGGAPGDGNRSLGLALEGALRAKGAKIERDQVSGAWRVDCAVRVTPIDAQQERVKLVWTLVAADGQSVGTLVQENPVARGRLRQKWGEVAAYAAEAAADGIWQVLQQIPAPGER